MIKSWVIFLQIFDEECWNMGCRYGSRVAHIMLYLDMARDFIDVADTWTEEL
jgi:hypothetical protein